MGAALILLAVIGGSYVAGRIMGPRLERMSRAYPAATVKSHVRILNEADDG
jgi:hypothetical protein